MEAAGDVDQVGWPLPDDLIGDAQIPAARVMGLWQLHIASLSLICTSGKCFRRAIERRALWMAEDAARELPNLPLEDALQLVNLYAARGSPKFERAAMRWLERYLTEGSPRLKHFAEVVTSLAQREPS
jgi:hypothetical protein